MARELRFDSKMSDAEGLMWRLEKDPTFSSTYANVSILDRAPDSARLLRRFERAATLVTRLHQRVQPAPANLGPPHWVDDPDFDITRHVRFVALPAPGSMRQLLDLATLIAADPWDRTRPLWSFTVVEGLEGGRAAIIQKTHHTVIDGEAGVQLSLQYIDLERDAPEPPALDPELLATSTPTAPATPSDQLRELLESSLRLPVGMVNQLRELLAEPAKLPALGLATAASVRTVVTQLSDTNKALSPLWTDRTLRRHLEALTVPFAPTKAAAKALGGTFNTAFITVAAQAAGAYHRRLGAPVDHLRASMAISTRTESSGSNAFGLARLLVPTAEMPIGERFALISEATDHARSASGGVSMDVLGAVIGAIPTSLVTRVARLQSQTVDFATSNVRMASVPCYIGGAQILANHPVGPLGGVAFNLTLLTYAGELGMGLNVDAGAVSEPELLRDELYRAFDELAEHA